MKVQRVGPLLLLVLTALVMHGVVAAGTRGGRMGRSKVGDDDPWMTDSGSDSEDEGTDGPSEMPGTVATTAPVVGGPALIGAATALPATPAAATAAPRVWTPSEGGSRPLTTMRLPRWATEDRGGLSAARYWANFKTGFGDYMSTDSHVYDSRFI